MVYDETLDQYVTLAKTTLQPGEETSGTLTHTITEADLDEDSKFINIATVVGEDPNGGEVEDEDDHEVVVTIPNPAIQLTKLADKEIFSVAGEEITYSFTVVNIGNVTLSGVTVEDPLLGGTIVLNSTTLEPGETAVGTGLYTVSQDDIENGSIENIATATGYAPNQDPVTDTDYVTVYGQKEIDFTIEKEADYDELKLGDIILYTITVKNTGNTILEEVQVIDEMLGINEIISNMSPGDEEVFEGEYTITQEDIDKGEIYNKAIAISEELEREDDVTVKLEKNSDIKLEKSAYPMEYQDIGDRITYTLVVTNTGNTTLTNVSVFDDTLGVVVLEDETLEPGQSLSGNIYYDVTQADIERGYIVNTATAEGYGPNEEKVTDKDSVGVEGLIPEEPVEPGDIINKYVNGESHKNLNSKGESFIYEIVVELPFMEVYEMEPSSLFGPGVGEEEELEEEVEEELEEELEEEVEEELEEDAEEKEPVEDEEVDENNQEGNENENNEGENEVGDGVDQDQIEDDGNDEEPGLEADTEAEEEIVEMQGSYRRVRMVAALELPGLEGDIIESVEEPESLENLELDEGNLEGYSEDSLQAEETAYEFYYDYTLVEITDTLEDVLEILGYRVLVDGVEDLYLTGLVAESGQTISLVLELADLLDYNGAEITLEIEARIRAGADLSSYENRMIPNFATAIFNYEEEYESNTVTVRPPNDIPVDPTPDPDPDPTPTPTPTPDPDPDPIDPGPDPDPIDPGPEPQVIFNIEPEIPLGEPEPEPEILELVEIELETPLGEPEVEVVEAEPEEIFEIIVETPLAEVLPQTGESDHLGLYLTGLILMALGLFLRRRKIV